MFGSSAVKSKRNEKVYTVQIHLSFNYSSIELLIKALYQLGCGSAFISMYEVLRIVGV